LGYPPIAVRKFYLPLGAVVGRCLSASDEICFYFLAQPIAPCPTRKPQALRRLLVLLRAEKETLGEQRFPPYAAGNEWLNFATANNLAIGEVRADWLLPSSVRLLVGCCLFFFPHWRKFFYANRPRPRGRRFPIAVRLACLSLLRRFLRRSLSFAGRVKN